jgi:hypothetical protein
VAWRTVKGQVFREAATIFCRLLRGDVLSSNDIEESVLERRHFRSDADWEQARALAGGVDRIPLPRRFTFENLKVVPQEWRRELIQPVIGSHDPELQEWVNQFLPVHVFNLSITSADVIESTHQRLSQAFHADGGPWRRSFMPRTTFVFLNAQPHLSPEAQRAAAHEEARAALGAYWKALQGTIDPNKVEKAATNALIGNPEDVARQAIERFHADDRLMLWFDFFNHDSARVIANQEAWMSSVAPRIAEALG